MGEQRIVSGGSVCHTAYLLNVLSCACASHPESFLIVDLSSENLRVRFLGDKPMIFNTSVIENLRFGAFHPL